jgi:hypothetical protein
MGIPGIDQVIQGQRAAGAFARACDVRRPASGSAVSDRMTQASAADPLRAGHAPIPANG